MSCREKNVESSNIQGKVKIIKKVQIFRINITKKIENQKLLRIYLTLIEYHTLLL